MAYANITAFKVVEKGNTPASQHCHCHPGPTADSLTIVTRRKVGGIGACFRSLAGRSDSEAGLAPVPSLSVVSVIRLRQHGWFEENS